MQAKQERLANTIAPAVVGAITVLVKIADIIFDIL